MQNKLEMPKFQQAIEDILQNKTSYTSLTKNKNKESKFKSALN